MKQHTYYNASMKPYLDTPSPETAKNMPSKTVPDMALPLGELLRRHAGGQNITILQPDYQADEEYDQLLANIPNMRELDRLDLLEKLKSDSSSMITKLKKDIAAKQKIQDEKNRIEKAKYDEYVANLKKAAEGDSLPPTPQ